MPSHARACSRPTLPPARPSQNGWMAIPKLPDRPKELDKPLPPEEDKPGTNETQHHPNPRAEPMPTGEQPFHPRSPYTTGND
jgi:hypothetical protein